MGEQTSEDASATPGRADPGRRSAGGGSWREMLAAFSVPAFSWYWGSQLLSGIGTWSQAVAQSWLVLDVTHSAVDLGTVTMLQFAPILVFSLFGGVVADRLPRRQVLIGTQIALTLQAVALGLLVASHRVTLWEIAVLAVVLGLTNALNNPAQQAFVPELVGLDLVADAVALNSVQFNGARMIGGAVGGLAIAFWGIAGALFLNSASFLPIVVVLLVIRPSHVVPRAKGDHRSALSEIREGLSYALATIPIRRVVILFGVVGLFGFNWQVAVPLIARFVLHRQATGFGDLTAALGAGSLVAALVLVRNQNATDRRLTIGASVLGLTLVGLGLSTSYLLSLALLGFAGAAGIVTSVTANTRLQLLTPNHLRGRVMSIYVLLMGGTTPIGSFLLGEVAGRFGTGMALIVFGSVTTGVVAAITVVRRRPSRSPAP